MQIRLENLRKTYMTGADRITAVNGISLTVPDNTVFGIIGKSGAGKSSLVRLVSLLEPPDDGAVYYDDSRVDNLSKKDLILKRRQIGMIFQNFNLFSSRTAGQNVAYPLEICKTPKAQINERVKEMLELVGLSDREDAPISTLSGGQKQRIAIARALATKPQILFCDEATSALDPQTTHSILNLIREIQKKMNLTVVMITHQMEVVRDACEMVAVIEKGSVVEQGLVREIFSHPQSATTKDFISHMSPSGAAGADGILRWSQDGGKYTLRFSGDDTDKPIISELLKSCNVEVNLRAAGIQHLAECDVGSMVIDITGGQDEIKSALDFLNAKGIKVEENK